MLTHIRCRGLGCTEGAITADLMFTGVLPHAGSRFVESIRDGKVLVVPGILTAALLYGLFDYVRSKSMVVCTEVTYCLIAAQAFWSIFTTSRALANEVSDK